MNTTTTPTETAVQDLAKIMVAAGELNPNRDDYDARVAELRTLTPEQVSSLTAEWGEYAADQAEAQHDMPPTDKCSHCGAELELSASFGWIDPVLVDSKCPSSDDGSHAPLRHEYDEYAREMSTDPGTPGPGALPHG